MYTKRPGIVLGFHGCDKQVVKEILNQKTQFEPSTNLWDWLGHGVYFWENDPLRALEFAQELKDKPNKKKKPIEEPAVIGAVLDLGYCLDLMERSNLIVLSKAYETLSKTLDNLPTNSPLRDSADLLLRPLDCLVIQTIHAARKDAKEKPYDSVRGVFWEGEFLYENAGFKDKNHVQVCIRNPNCIKGFFLPRDLDKKWDKP